jgi:gliding motility-associated-like protein
LDDYGVYVPSAFTPNEDGYNDGFGPVLYNLPLTEINYTFSIYSRDGERVFYSKNPKQKWHGNKDGGDLYVLQDSYVWVLELNLPDAEERRIFKGDVKILR